jgi:hypothetical protein
MMRSERLVGATAGIMLAIVTLVGCTSNNDQAGREAPNSSTSEPSGTPSGTAAADLTTMSMEDGFVHEEAAHAADLALELEGPHGPVPAGEPLRYSVRIRDLGPNPATFVRLNVSVDTPLSEVEGAGCTVDGPWALSCVLNDPTHLAWGEAYEGEFAIVLAGAPEDGVVGAEVAVSHYWDATLFKRLFEGESTDATVTELGLSDSWDATLFGREGLVRGRDLDDSNDVAAVETRVGLAE